MVWPHSADKHDVYEGRPEKEYGHCCNPTNLDILERRSFQLIERAAAKQKAIFRFDDHLPELPALVRSIEFDVEVVEEIVDNLEEEASFEVVDVGHLVDRGKRETGQIVPFGRGSGRREDVGE